MAECTLTNNRSGNFQFKLIPELEKFLWRPSIAASVWMTTWYAVWLWLRTIYGENGHYALMAVITGFGPLLLLSFWDYKRGLLYTILATPLLIAPIIAHSFTQGFGDLFAIATILGYLFRHPNPFNWTRLWQSSYIWLVLILTAAALSLIAAPFNPHAMYGIKFGIAEIAGFCLAIAYFAILMQAINSARDMQAVLYVVGCAILIVGCFGLASIEMVRACVGGYGVRTILTSNQTTMSSFGSANYHASYIITVLPLILFFYFKSIDFPVRRKLGIISIIFFVFLIQTSGSRSGLIGLGVIWLGWLLITRWKPGTRMVSIVLALMLPATLIVWWYPACTCKDAPPWTCTPRYLLQQEISRENSILQNAGFSSKILKSQVELNSQVEFKEVISIAKDSAAGTPKGWSNNVRQQLAINAFNTWKEYPLTGVGVGLLQNYSVVDGQANRAHNMALTILAEQGVIGILVWGGWWIYLLSIFWRFRRQIVKEGSPFAFLILVFLGVALQSMFMDQYRMLWIWQLSALILATQKIYGKKNVERKSNAIQEDSFIS